MYEIVQAIKKCCAPVNDAVQVCDATMLHKQWKPVQKSYSKIPAIDADK